MPVNLKKEDRQRKGESQAKRNESKQLKVVRKNISDNGEFDPGSGRTLAACFIHASRTRIGSLLPRKVADG